MTDPAGAGEGSARRHVRCRVPASRGVRTPMRRARAVSVFVQRFSSTPRGARLARLLVLHQPDAWGVPHGSEASDTAALLVAELAANAVTHGRVPGGTSRSPLRSLAGPCASRSPTPGANSGRPHQVSHALRCGRWRSPAGACSWWRHSPTDGRFWTECPSVRRSWPSWICRLDVPEMAPDGRGRRADRP